MGERYTIPVDYEFSKSILKLSHQARQAEDDGDTGRAIDIMEKVVASEPENPANWTFLGSLYEDNNQLDSARNAFEQCLALKPDSGYAHFVVGRFLLDSGNAKEAESFLSLAVQLKPDAVAHFYLAICQEMLDKIDDAESSFLTCLSLEPNHEEAMYNLGNLYVSKGKHEAAENLLRQAIDIDPNYVWAMFSLGRMLVSQERYLEAKPFLLSVLESDLPEPHKAQAEELLGQAG